MADGNLLVQTYADKIAELFPPNPAGNSIVDDRYRLATELVSIASNTWSPEITELDSAAQAARDEKELVQNELTGARSELDLLRGAVANAHAALQANDPGEAQTILTQVVI